MVFNKDNLKLLSICHIVVAVIFFSLGLADRLVVRIPFSFVGIPCWTSALIIITGILGLVAGHQGRPPSPTMINAIWSFSAGCVILSTLVMFVYATSLATLAFEYEGYKSSFTSGLGEAESSYAGKLRTYLAIISLILIVSVVEMLIAFGTAKSCHGQTGNYQQLQENVPSGSYPHGGQMPVQINQQPCAYGGAMPGVMVQQPSMVAMPVSSVNQ